MFLRKYSTAIIALTSLSQYLPKFSFVIAHSLSFKRPKNLFVEAD